MQDDQIQVESWGPLIQGKGVPIPGAARGCGKHGKTVARGLCALGAGHDVLPLPKSNHYDLMVQNADVFDFTLDDEDFRNISALEAYGRIAKHPDTAPFLGGEHVCPAKGYPRRRVGERANGCARDCLWYAAKRREDVLHWLRRFLKWRVTRRNGW